MLNYTKHVPVGIVLSQGRTYFLLKPTTNESEASWEDGLAERFLVTSTEKVNVINSGKSNEEGDLKFESVYPAPFSLLTSNWSIEYRDDLPVILCQPPVNRSDTLFDEILRDYEKENPK